jgi:DNA polymerase/3'-5' exonuclease PolX
MSAITRSRNVFICTTPNAFGTDSELPAHFATSTTALPTLRRGQETVGGSPVASAQNPAGVIKHLLRFPLITKVVEQLDSRCTVELAEGATVALRAVKPNQFSLALFWETGSEAHLTKVHDIANRKGLTLDREALKLDIVDGKANIAVAQEGSK